MAVRLTDPFNEKVRARIFDTYISSSGSEHDGENDVVSPSSSSSPVCLSYLVQNFLEDDSKIAGDFDSGGPDSNSGDFLRSDPTAVIEEVINPTVRNNADQFRNQLLANVNRAVVIFANFRKNKSIYNRNLMAYLREIGYNAGVCKTRWDSNGGLSGGSYEFIDVFRQDCSPPARYLVDGDFAGEFEIARETVNYAKLRSSLPRVFVGKPEDMKKIVRVMCDEARRSMKINGLTLPPWRKNRYMQAKWLGPYRRSTNPLPVSVGPEMPKLAVKCRCVGFELAGDGGRMFVTPVTRTR